jgi:hypothetical protein
LSNGYRVMHYCTHATRPLQAPCAHNLLQPSGRAAQFQPPCASHQSQRPAAPGWPVAPPCRAAGRAAGRVAGRHAGWRGGGAGVACRGVPAALFFRRTRPPCLGWAPSYPAPSPFHPFPTHDRMCLSSTRIRVPLYNVGGTNIYIRVYCMERTVVSDCLRFGRRNYFFNRSVSAKIFL